MRRTGRNAGVIVAIVLAGSALACQAGAQRTIPVQTLPQSDSTVSRTPFSMAAPNMRAASLLIGCYSVTLEPWSKPQAPDSGIPVPSQIELLAERHTRIYIGFGLVARTPRFSAQRDAYPPAWSPVGDDSLQVRAWADGASSVMFFLRRQSNGDLRGPVRYFSDARVVDDTGRWMWETYPAATASLRRTQCESNNGGGTPRSPT
jgi:hypothetical protein